MKIPRFALCCAVALAVLVVRCTSLCAEPAGPTTAPVAPIDLKQIATILEHGDSAARLAALRRVMATPPADMPDAGISLLPAAAKCAEDSSPQTRAEAALLIGGRWVQLLNPPAPQAIAIEEKLCRDPDPLVRHDAVSASLKWVKHKSDDEIAAVVDAAMLPQEYDSATHGQAVFALQGVPKQKLIPLLDKYWAAADREPDHAAWAYVLYLGATGEEPPGVERLDKAGTFVVWFDSRGGYSRGEIDAELKAIVPADVSREWHLQIYRGGVHGGVVVQGVAGRRQVVAALEKSHKLRCYSDVSRVETLISPEGLAKLRASDTQADAPATGPSTQPSYAAAFDDLYDQLGKMYPNFKMKEIDWKAVGDELRPRAAQVPTQRQFGLLVEELVARLEDSHAIVLPGTVAPPEPDLPEWDPGLACLIDDRDRPVVYVVEPNSPADRAGIKPGMTVVSVNGIAVEDAMQNWMRQTSRYFGYSSQRTLRYDAARGFLRQSDKGAAVALVLEDPDGKRTHVTVPADVGSRYLPRLPVPRENIPDAANVACTTLGNGIGYIYVRRVQNGLEAELDACLRELGPIRGLVIDVRGNSGGGFDPESAVRNFDLSPDDTAEPQRPRYRGPIAILTDERCISAGEGWASWFVAKKRARLFGATTAGASSRKEMYTLSNGLYQVVVPVKAYSGFLDRPIERRGLEPDVPVRCTARDLANGRDTVVDTAVRWLDTVPK